MNHTRHRLRNGKSTAMPRQPAQAYVICSTPRSGSTLLCRLLSQTGVAGQPDSHFHTPSLDRWREVYGVSTAANASERDILGAVFQAARKRGTGQNGMFGLRMQRGSFAFFMAQADVLYPDRAHDVARFEAAFGPTRFIHLSRQDKVAQAISRLKAEQTGLWHQNPDGSTLERLAPTADPYYDFDAITRTLSDLKELEVAWENWFAKEGVKPLRIDYDHLAADPRAVLKEVLGALSLDTSGAGSVSIPTAKLADATNAQWAARFRGDSPRAE